MTLLVVQRSVVLPNRCETDPLKHRTAQKTIVEEELERRVHRSTNMELGCSGQADDPTLRYLQALRPEKKARLQATALKQLLRGYS